MADVLNSKVGPVTFEAPYFSDLIADPSNALHPGRLTKDPACHALWYYYCLASKNLVDVKKDMAYEGDVSQTFSLGTARRLLENIANMYVVQVSQMVRYWAEVDNQRRSLNLTQNAELPVSYRFRFN